MTMFHEPGHQSHARIFRLKLDGAIRGRASGVFKDDPSVGHLPDFYRDARNKGFKATPRYKYVDRASHAGLGFCHLQIAKLYVAQIRFHASNGHGFSAEQGNHLIDRIRLRGSSMLGDDNAKHGADRLVDGVHVQSKYCGTGKACIDNCFTPSGRFKYVNKDGTPMQIEVPSDKFAQAVEAMKERIRNGQVPGITDPEEATQIVRKGSLTYKQAVNIAKFGTIESITFDAVNGIKVGLISGSLSAIVAFAFAIRAGEPMEKALRSAAWVGFKVGGMALAISIVTSQIGRTAFEHAFRGISKDITRKLSSKVASALVRGMTGQVLHGNVARVKLAKLLRGNMASLVVTTVVMSVPDIVRTARGRISGVQLGKNLSSMVAGVAGGYGGTLAGAALGTMVFPVAGTYIGGAIGGLVGGYAGQGITGALLDNLVIDDAVAMLVIFEQELINVVIDHCMVNSEVEAVMKALIDRGLPKMLEDIFSQQSQQRPKYTYDVIEKAAIVELKKRGSLLPPSSDVMLKETAVLVGELTAEFDAGNLGMASDDEPHIPETPFGTVFKAAFSREGVYVDESFLWGDQLRTDMGRKKLGNALKHYGRTHGGVPIHTVLAVVDTTILGTASEGAIFTEDAVWIRNWFSRAVKLDYTDFDASVGISDKSLYLKDGKNIGLPSECLVINVMHMISLIKHHYRRP